MGGVVLQNSDRSPTLPHSLTKQTLPPLSRVGCPVAVYLGLCDADADA